MLTSLYYAIPILKSLFSGFCASLPGGYHSRSLLMGILGRWAGHDEMTITAIAKLFGVSRQAVYGNIRRLAALENKFQDMPENPGHCIMVTSKDIDRAILSLALDAHAPLEGIQRVLTCMYGEEAYRSIGYISELLTRAGAFAREITRTIPLQGIHQGANDELFDAGDHPVLTGVDVESTYIYLMLDMNDRKGETWELAMETLKDLGLNLKVAISDAGSGLLKGVTAACNTIRALALAAILLVGISAVNTSTADAKDLTLVNRTGYDIVVLNCVPASADNWWEDVLGNSIWPDGKSITINFDNWATAEKWDFKAHYSDGFSDEWTGVNVRNVDTIILNKDGSNSYY